MVKLNRHKLKHFKQSIYLIDLDDTLHNASASILPEINRQMTVYMANALNLDMHRASQLRHAYWVKYGATLLGMIKHHNTDLNHFLYHTHQFDSLESFCAKQPSILSRLKKLQGIKIVLTNAPRGYADEILKIVGLNKHIDGLISIEDMVIHSQLRPKPSKWLWPHLQRVLKQKKLILIDDTRGHLHSAARFGYKVAWVNRPDTTWRRFAPKGHVKLRLKCLSQVARYKVI